MAKTKPPWEKSNPRRDRPSRALSDKQKAAARQRAEQMGRRYPNLVDNLWASRLPRE
jgi:hypothetical protein